MLRRLIKWIKYFFRCLFGKQQKSSGLEGNILLKNPPLLSDTDLEFLFTELLEGVHQARGKSWALKWLQNIEHRVPLERWLQWLEGFRDILMASTSPNDELASRMVQLGELDIGDLSEYAHTIGIDLLNRNEKEMIWEYEPSDYFSQEIRNINGFELSKENIFTSEDTLNNNTVNISKADEHKSLLEGEYQTVTLDELFSMLRQDNNLCQQIAQQLGIYKEDPETIIQELINQFNKQNQ